VPQPEVFDVFVAPFEKALDAIDNAVIHSFTRLRLCACLAAILETSRLD
jgi:hypothetical protein